MKHGMSTPIYSKGLNSHLVDIERILTIDDNPHFRLTLVHTSIGHTSEKLFVMPPFWNQL